MTCWYAKYEDTSLARMVTMVTGLRMIMRLSAFLATSEVNLVDFEGVERGGPLLLESDSEADESDENCKTRSNRAMTTCMIIQW